MSKLVVINIVQDSAVCYTKHGNKRCKFVYCVLNCVGGKRVITTVKRHISWPILYVIAIEHFVENTFK